MAQISTNPIVIELPGPPQGKARARVTRFGTYTPAKTRAYEAALAWRAKTAMAGRPPLDGPLAVRVKAYMPIPRSWSKKKQAAALAGTIRPISKPDWDNLAKACDALNGIVWTDDARVVDGAVHKVYSDRPRLRVEVARSD